MEYKASLDIKSKLITAFVGGLFVVITIVSAREVNFEWAKLLSQPAFWIGTLTLTAILLFCYLYRPMSYRIENNQVIVKRPLKDLVIDFKNIKDVKLPAPESMKWTIRLFGNGGVFGYTGKYRNSAYGGMTCYATKTDNYLMIVTKDNDRIILTPDDTKMIDEIKSAAMR